MTCFYLFNILPKCSNETIQSLPKRSIFGHFQPHSVSELTCHMFHQNKEIRSTDCFLEKEILSTIFPFLVQFLFHVILHGKISVSKSYLHLLLCCCFQGGNEAFAYAIPFSWSTPHSHPQYLPDLFPHFL